MRRSGLVGLIVCLNFNRLLKTVFGGVEIMPGSKVRAHQPGLTLIQSKPGGEKPAKEHICQLGGFQDSIAYKEWTDLLPLSSPFYRKRSRRIWKRD